MQVRGISAWTRRSDRHRRHFYVGFPTAERALVACKGAHDRRSSAPAEIGVDSLAPARGRRRAGPRSDGAVQGQRDGGMMPPGRDASAARCTTWPLAGREITGVSHVINTNANSGRLVHRTGYGRWGRAVASLGHAQSSARSRGHRASAKTEIDSGGREEPRRCRQRERVRARARPARAKRSRQRDGVPIPR